MPVATTGYVEVEANVRYTNRNQTLWTADGIDGDSTQPVLIPSKKAESMTLTLDVMPSAKEFDLSLRKYITKVGDEVLVKINITNIKGFKGIATFVAHKVYDESIFEYKGIEPANGWQLKADNVNMILNSSENHASGTIAVMKFKAIKEIGNTTIKLDSIDAGGEDFDGEPAGICYKDNNVNEPSVKFTVTAMVEKIIQEEITTKAEKTIQEEITTKVETITKVEITIQVEITIKAEITVETMQETIMEAKNQVLVLQTKMTKQLQKEMEFLKQENLT